MASQSSVPYAINFGKHWARLKFTGDGSAPDRDYVAEQLLFQSSWVSPTDIYSFIALPNRKDFELVFYNEAPLRRFLEVASAKSNDVKWRDWSIESSVAVDVMTIVVKFWTGRVSDHDIELYLKRYCDIIQSVYKPLDKFGIWYGVRKYRIRMHVNTSGQLVDLPNSISLGPYNGRIIYTGQVTKCFICQATDHQVKDCPTMKCWRCGSLGHKASTCQNNSTCSLCGEKGHTFFKCPKSFVNKIKGLSQLGNTAAPPLRSDSQQQPGTQQRQPADQQPEGSQQQPAPQQPGGSLQQPAPQQLGGMQRETTTQQPGGPSQQPAPQQPGGSLQQPAPQQLGGMQRETTTQQPGGPSQQPAAQQPGGKQRETTTQQPGGPSQQPAAKLQLHLTQPTLQTRNPPPEVSLQSGEEKDLSISGIESMSDDSDGDENEENEQSYESASESPSSDFSSTGLTAGQRASSTPAADNADSAPCDSNSGSFSTTPEFPSPEVQHDPSFEEVKKRKKRNRTITYKENKRVDVKPSP
ncbi:translation initiation factor IF-2 [Perca fluviatilis]|uniref:translation initiation factor IF-2 n=1 Tax=Perca fluviatilis TaxID=8168 RepID=UPI001966C2D9|nr:translation initiation factor IF-2 [Perca fluviatilis]